MWPPWRRHLIDHLDLEPVPLGPHGPEVDAAQGLGPVGAEPRSGVVHPQPQHERGVDVPALRQQPAVPRPVGDRSPRDIARSRPPGPRRLRGGRSARGAPRARATGRRPSRRRPPSPGRGPRRTRRDTHFPTRTSRARRSTWMFPSSEPNRSAISAVESGLPSSTTSTPPSGNGGPDATQHVIDVLGLVVRGEDDEGAHGGHLRCPPCSLRCHPRPPIGFPARSSATPPARALAPSLPRELPTMSPRSPRRTPPPGPPHWPPRARR